MTRGEFRGFLAAFREVMARRGHDPAELEICESLDVAGLPMPDGLRETIRREHIEPSDGTSSAMAEAVYDVYLADRLASCE
jgi:hypothetical protein